MPVYVFRQNFSGGGWKGPAKYVLCEAKNPDVANQMAKVAGVYFDGCDSGRDCSCCGDRWHRASGKLSYETVEEAVAALEGSFYVLVRGGYEEIATA